MAPAIAYAENGWPVTWHTSYKIAQDLALLNAFPCTRDIFLNNGQPYWTLDENEPAMLCQTDLAKTLREIAAQGPRAFYEGETARTIVDHIAANGGLFSLEDFSRYQAKI